MTQTASRLLLFNGRMIRLGAHSILITKPAWCTYGHNWSTKHYCVGKTSIRSGAKKCRWNEHICLIRFCSIHFQRLLAKNATPQKMYTLSVWWKYNKCGYYVEANAWFIYLYSTFSKFTPLTIKSVWFDTVVTTTEQALDECRLFLCPTVYYLVLYSKSVY